MEDELKEIKNKEPQLAPIENEIINMKHKENVKQRMNDQDRRNNLVIYGVKEGKNETNKETSEKIKEILEKADIKIESTYEVQRLGKPNTEETAETARKRPVKVMLNNHWDKRIIYSARTKMYGKGNIGIFINEDLPKIQQTLLMICRKAKRANKLETSWTEDGIVHVKISKHIPDVIIRNIEQLEKETGYKHQKENE